MSSLGIAIFLMLAAAPADTLSPPAVPAGTVPSTPGAPDAPTTPVQDNVGEAQVPIVAGNVAGARERALDEALRRVLETSLVRSFDEATRTAQARKVKSLLAKPRRYVRRYRTLEEGEVTGAYRIKVEADVDEATLRRELEKSAPAPLPTGAQGGPGGLALVGEGIAEGTDAVAQALAAAGLKTTRTPGAGLPVAYVSAASSEEGVVRGPGLLAVSCRLTARVVGRNGAELHSETISRRAFAERPEVARSSCFAPAASDLASQILRAAGGELHGGGDLRTITIDAQLNEPAAVPVLLKVLRGVGAASSVELRRVSAGHAEIRVKSRQPAATLIASAARDAASSLVLATVEISGDVIRVRVSSPSADPGRPPASPGAAPSVPPAPAVPTP